MGTRAVGSRRIETANEDKVLFPGDGITKGDLIAYYERVAERMVPHVRDRPLVMERYPDGIDADGFMHKHVPGHFPEWIRTATVDKEDGTVTHVVVEDAATLVYLANQACITPHVWLSRLDRPHHPDQLVFDLDPSEDTDPRWIPETARALARLLDELGAGAVAKSSGSRGIHVVVPLDRSGDFDLARDVAHAVATRLVERQPDRLTVAPRKAERGRRLFIDTLRNAYAQHVAAPYAVRARPGAPVAVPLSWDEATSPRFDPARITIRNVFRRLAHKRDPWADWDDAPASLPELARRLDGPAR